MFCYPTPAYLIPSKVVKDCWGKLHRSPVRDFCVFISFFINFVQRTPKYSHFFIKTQNPHQEGRAVLLLVLVTKRHFFSYMFHVKVAFVAKGYHSMGIGSVLFSYG